MDLDPSDTAAATHPGYAAAPSQGALHLHAHGELVKADPDSHAPMQPLNPLPTPGADTLPSPLGTAAPPAPLDADLATFTSLAAAAAPASAALDTEPDRKPAVAEMLNASASASASPRASTESEDRKPDLPPPFPFASTSAAAVEIDAARAAAAAVKSESSGGSTPSGSGTPKGEEYDDDGDDIEKYLAQVKGQREAKGKGKGKKGGGANKGSPEVEPQLIGHLPVATDEAGRTYVELDESTYTNKTIGDVRYFDADMARCDCVPEPNVPLDEQACGEHSQCMNRLMQIECVRGDCKCGKRCQNQRFQKRQYAPIEIVKTEKKGFGVRAEADIPADAFIYEYVGEVIGPKPFEVKMKAYANEGIKHFYFMALDKDVFIDATKKGGKGRFLNHSCAPNCYVAKWTVGRKMRMGIFAKRAIRQHEELTFNYNVDRYGHVAQECFCGEPGCVGFIGGKTQTDLGGMDDLYIDALGIAAEVEALGLKGSKKKKGRKLDEDFTPTLHPIELDEVPKVSSAIRQALQTRRILEKLLTRVQMTTDEEVLRSLMRLHGLNLMNNVLREYPDDVHVISLDLEILAKWRLQTRNKIESSRIEESVERCLALADEHVQTLARDVLDAWKELQMGYRIPKALLDASDDPDRKRPSSFDFESLSKRARLDEPSPSSEPDHPAFVRPPPSASHPPPRRSRALPDGWRVEYDREADRDVFVNLVTGARQWDVPLAPPARAAAPERERERAPALDANALIAEAEAAARAAREAEEARAREEKEAKEEERRVRAERKRREKEEKGERVKEKKVMGLFSGVVVLTMSKYKGQFEPEAFKKRAREVSELLVEKEKKRPSYATDAYDALAPEKEAKVKAFVKEWVKKLIERKKDRPSSSSASAQASVSRRQGSSSSTPRPAEPSPATPTVAPSDGGDVHMNGNGAGAPEAEAEAGTPK
ncbi:histone methyltransferase set2 [Rhodotorula kratochvilovae]